MICIIVALYYTSVLDKTVLIQFHHDGIIGYLYMRVDIVLQDGNPIIMEVELAEPDLLFKYIENDSVRNQGIKLLSKSIVRRIK